MRDSGDLSKASSADILIQAVIDLWETHGHASISTRLLTQRTGITASSIYHHFGDMERLSVLAQDAAHKQAAIWCAAQVHQIASAPDLSPVGLASLLATVIDEWNYGKRPLAFAWRECQALARRNPVYRPVHQAWNAMWMLFWNDICGLIGRPDWAEPTVVFFQGECMLHLLRWRRLVDRACLDESCQGWVNMVSGRLSSEGEWRRFARSEAQRMTSPAILNGGVAEQIASAAADVMAERGLAGLTHRAVAAKAGVTLGTVSYNFRSSTDLLHGAYAMIYRYILLDPPEEELNQTGEGDIVQRLVESDVRMYTRLKALCEDMFVAVARDPTLTDFGAQLRYLRGGTSAPALQQIVGPDRFVSRFDGALLSSFSMGQMNVAVGMSDDEAKAANYRSFTKLLALLGCH